MEIRVSLMCPEGGYDESFQLFIPWSILIVNLAVNRKAND
jgi:hypothetical protein